MIVDNAIIMAAGTSSRFAPLSYEKHKALIEVKGEVLIERQIRQLIEASIKDIYIVTGYKAEQFDYLKHKFNVKLINNSEYAIRNNNSSIWAARDVIKNSYICSSDNYFSINPFRLDVDFSYYAAEYSDCHTNEWCMKEDKDGFICEVKIGGENSWYMMGHTFWDSNFSSKFIKILTDEYDLPDTKEKLWEKIFMEHLSELKMKIMKYPENVIYEFDTLDELRTFDNTYIFDTRSKILKSIASKLNIKENDITNISAIKSDNNEATGFKFCTSIGEFSYNYENMDLIKL